MSSSREDFEVAVMNLYPSVDLSKHGDGVYTNDLVGAAWWGWRHGRPEHADTPTDSQPSGEHPHNDALDEYRQPVHVGELDPAQRLALACGELK